MAAVTVKSVDRLTHTVTARQHSIVADEPPDAGDDQGMAPYELLQAGGSLDLGDQAGLEGIAWLRLLAAQYPRSVWLNPEPPQLWRGNTIELIRRVFSMFPLTLTGLGEAVARLTRGVPAKPEG